MNRTSTARSLLDPRALFTGAALTTLLLTGSGCGAIGEGPKGAVQSDVAPSTPGDDGGGNNGGGANGGATGDATPPPGDTPLPSEPCGEIALATKTILDTNCSSCHSPGAQAKGGFSNVLDANALVSSGKIVPGKPDQSPLYVRMSAGSMPPPATNPRPSAADVAKVRDWILCNAIDWDAPVGGAAAFLSVDDRLRIMRDDLRKVPNPADRKRMRYIDFSNLSNGGYSAAQVDEYREAVSLTLNSLSYGSVVVPGLSVDPDKLLYRIDLRDYGWDADNWDQIVEDYPYVVQYDPDSEAFPYDEDAAEQIRRETGTLAAYIQADWLIAHASQPPLYYDMLGFTGLNLDQIAASVGIDIQQNIDAEQVVRAGFTNSGVSEQNRMIERHELPGRQGAFWLSYDFLTNTGDENLQVNPLDFVAAGGEVIFNLPNGLQAYAIVDAAGNLLDEVPNDVATDPNSATREVVGAVSCMGCHANGIIRKDDTIRPLYEQTNQAINADEREAVLRLYRPVSETQALINKDNERYARARTTAEIVKLGELTMSRVVNAHERSLNLNQVAAVVGVTPEELRNALGRADMPGEIVTLGQSGGLISREVFEDVFEELITGLGLGVALDTPALVQSVPGTI